MNKIKTSHNNARFKEVIRPEIKRFAAVIIFTLIYGIGVAWFLESSVIPMYTGGMPGIAQVLRDLLGHNKMGILAEQYEGVFMSAFIMIANIPLLLLGWFGVSKKFTLYSLVSVVIQSTVIGFIPALDLGLSEPSHAVVAAIMGGLLIGVGTGGSLKYGTSTGGLDIVAQYLAFKNGKSVGSLSMAMNVGIALLGGLILGGLVVETSTGTTAVIGAGVIVSYTLIRIIITTIVTDKIHTSYNYLSVEIITENPQEMVDEILHRVFRGVTLSKVEGAYSHHEKTQVMVVISSYELELITELIKRVDPHAFVIAIPVRDIVGNFKRKAIA